MSADGGGGELRGDIFGLMEWRLVKRMALALRAGFGSRLSKTQ